MTAEEYYQEGKRLYEAKDYEAAAVAYHQKATELDDRHADAWVGLASACWGVSCFTDMECVVRTKCFDAAYF